ncbi:MAG: hypothetical protein DRJ64_07775, partial [Thermoprotei archaeon]
MSWKGVLRKAGIIGTDRSLEFSNQTRFRNNLLTKTTVSTINTTAAVALTSAQLLGELILRDPNGANRADTVPTATLLIAAI